jgi:hypothetical protein
MLDGLVVVGQTGSIQGDRCVGRQVVVHRCVAS